MIEKFAKLNLQSRRQSWTYIWNIELRLCALEISDCAFRYAVNSPTSFPSKKAMFFFNYWRALHHLITDLGCLAVVKHLNVSCNRRSQLTYTVADVRRGSFRISMRLFNNASEYTWKFTIVSRLLAKRKPVTKGLTCSLFVIIQTN